MLITVISMVEAKLIGFFSLLGNSTQLIIRLSYCYRI